MYTYIYIYIERERERERMSLYIYIYVCICVCVCVCVCIYIWHCNSLSNRPKRSNQKASKERRMTSYKIKTQETVWLFQYGKLRAAKCNRGAIL